MLSYLLEKTTSVVSGLANAGESIVDYVIEDIQSIPDAIEKGWDNPVLGDSKEFTDTLDEVVEKTKFGRSA